MLQVREICKEYKTGGYVQKALNNISLSLRDNEFVAILGPSGSGKTTLLNLIGGLDRYDSGDLIINGTSTKEYTDRDWDAYRNHSVGFIFQSYNLIPHQTVLANVELALTIAGISKKERAKRAREALERVGLADHIHKLPNQLSGGQMQRVAIARALINEPSVLLADEPTGALDSETSIQVMELLKEVAKDRLVVMVTHNPELARDYANRIVELRDGSIISDTNPYTPDDEPIKDKRRLGKASMSFFTALGLSFMNLRTKLSRTLLVSFAGSIGIIGIALILSLSKGTNAYIDSIQRETLSEYPIQLQKNAMDLSAIASARQSGEETNEGFATELQLVGNLFATASTNDLGAFREYLESHKSEIEKLARSVEYRYNASPLIFSVQNGKVIQVHPNSSLSFLGLNSSLAMSSSYFNMTDVFHLMPEERSLYEDQYDVLAGRWPENYTEIVLVLTQSGKVSDMSLYSMGLKDHTILEEMIETVINGGNVDNSGENAKYAYEDFLGVTFRLACKSELFTYDDAHKVWTDHSDDAEYLKSIAENGEEMRIVGVVMQKEDSSAAMLSTGMNYMPSLIYHVIDEAAESAPVLAQMADPSVNLLTGTRFEDENGSAFSQLASMFSVDADAIKNAFGFDESALEIDLSAFDDPDMDYSDLIDPSELANMFPEISMDDLTALLNTVRFNISLEGMEELFGNVLSSYLEFASSDPSTDYASLPDAIRAYFATDEARELLAGELQDIVDEISSEVLTEERFSEIISHVMTGFSDYVLNAGGPDLEELLEQYQNGEADIADIVRLFADYIPPYLQSDAARQLLRQELNSLLSDISALVVNQEHLSRIFNDILDGYETYAEEEGLPLPSLMMDSFSEYMDTDEAHELISSAVSEMVDTSEFERQLARMMARYSNQFAQSFTRFMESFMSQIFGIISDRMTSAMSSLAEGLPNAFTIDTDAFAEAVNMNMGDSELRSFLSSLMSGETSTYESNLSNFGYADLSEPSEITIYPVSFDSKSELIRLIDSYNESMLDEGREEKVIHYVDMVGTMMNSITEIVDAISYVLIAFVSVSLVVSSIMIGVITYISVLERRKEIGILRAIGASKRNVSSVFNAETFIIGSLSGTFGVVITWLLLIPVNIVIHKLSGQQDLSAILPVPSALILVLLSIVLTLIGGFIPSKSAAKSDPVTALRTE